MKAWRRSEPRVARPFFAVAALERALDETILLVGEREREIEDDVVLDLALALPDEEDRLVERPLQGGDGEERPRHARFGSAPGLHDVPSSTGRTSGTSSTVQLGS